MKNLLLRSLLFLCAFYSKAVQASTDITTTQTSTVNVNSDNQVINITGAGNLAVSSGVAISNSAFSNTVININTSSPDNGISATDSAISISGSGSLSSLTITSGTVTNSGSFETLNLSGLGGVTNITVGQDSGNTATISTEVFDGHTIVSSTTNNTDFTITNKATGTITTLTDITSFGNAISLSDSDGGSKLTLNNTGTITAVNSAVDLNGFSGSVTNSGTINGGIVQNGADDFVITNSGTINGSVTLGTGSSLILNAGTVTGRVLMASASGTSVTFNGGNLIGDVIYDGSVFVNATTTNNGNIGYFVDGGVNRITSFEIAADKTLTTTNGSIYTSNISLGTGSTLNLGSGLIDASGSFTAGSNVNITAATFTNSASAIALTVSPSVTSVTLTGNAILSATTLNLTLPNTVAAGTITLLDAASISGISTISGSNININGSGSNSYGLTTFSAAVVGNKLLLTATAVAAPTLTSSNDQSTFNAIAAASTNGNLATVQNYLGSSSNSNSQKEEAIASTTAQVDNSTNRIAFNNISTTSGIISARLESVRSNNFNPAIIDTSFAGNLFNQPLQVANNPKLAYPLFVTLNGNDAFSKSAVWIQTFGSKIAQGNTSSTDGYNANSGGVMIGADKKLAADFILGINSGYSKTSISARNSFKSTNIETYQAGIYTGYDAKSYFLNASLGLVINNYSSDRYITVANASAKADYTGMGYNARAELGRNYHFNNEILLTPTLVVTAATNQVNSYNESGAGTLDLNVKTDRTNFFEGRVGAALSQLLTTKQGTQLRPVISASYGYDFAGDEQKSTATFIGQNTSFATSGAKVAQGSLMLGTGVSFYTKNDVTVSVNYGLEYRSDYVSNSGWLRVGYKF